MVEFVFSLLGVARMQRREVSRQRKPALFFAGHGEFHHMRTVLIGDQQRVVLAQANAFRIESTGQFIGGSIDRGIAGQGPTGGIGE